MAAEVQIHELTSGTTGVNKAGSTVLFKSADETTVNDSNPLLIPSSGKVCSFTKQLRLYVAVAPAIEIDLLRVYSDGGNGMGRDVLLQYDVQAAFAANIDTDIAGSDLFAKIRTNPIDLDTNNPGPFTATGYIGDILRLQMVIETQANPGTTPGETITFAFNEA